MDSLITGAALALAKGDPLGALNRVALREDAPALALRGIAMAQLGDLERAKLLLRNAARTFGAKQAVARARCVVAETEIALATRDLVGSSERLNAARQVLDAHADRTNAAYARHLEVRLMLLFGRIGDAEQALEELDATHFPPAFRALHELTLAGIALRRIHTQAARAALDRAADAAQKSGIPSLMAEVEKVSQVLQTPAARLVGQGKDRLLLLEEVEALLATKALIVDACRYEVRSKAVVVSLARRPILFILARALGEAWPYDMPRDQLIARVFRLKLADESHRARLRVEIGRLRAALRPIADINATPQGFILIPSRVQDLVVLARPVEEKHSAILAILADGEAWSSSALALVLATSQRTVQRALDTLAAAGKVQSFGRGQACRWIISPVPAFTTTLLLPGPLPSH